MNATSLEHKTIRPGRLIGYSYYHSNRQPLPRPKPVRPITVGRAWRRWTLLAVFAAAALIFVPLLRSGSPASSSRSANTASPNSSLSTPPAAKSSNAPAVAAQPPTNHCASNKLSQFVLVSISARHMWACEGERSLYDTPVVTGIDYLAADKTPTGTYHVYSKETNVTLAGSDSTGSWSDPVHYWMPFLYNQYGTYGFHDATWRQDSAFGNISPNSADGSHGCVELPLGAAEWLYNWAHAGTTVTVEA